jgi:hypothetical protein
MCSQSSRWSAQNSHEKIKLYREKTTAGTGGGCEQAQGHQLLAHKLTNQADGHLNTQLKEKQFTSKKPLPVPAVVVSKPRSMSYEHTCSQSSSLIAQNSIEWKNKLQAKKPLPVTAVTVSKLGAISCELRSSQTSWWSPQNSRDNKKNYKQKTTTSTGSGSELAQGHQLRAHMLTIKLIDSSAISWKEKY